MLSVNGNRQKSTSLVHIVIRLQNKRPLPGRMRCGPAMMVQLSRGNGRYAVAAAGGGFPRWA